MLHSQALHHDTVHFCMAWGQMTKTTVVAMYTRSLSAPMGDFWPRLDLTILKSRHQFGYVLPSNPRHLLTLNFLRSGILLVARVCKRSRLRRAVTPLVWFLSHPTTLSSGTPSGKMFA